MRWQAQKATVYWRAGREEKNVQEHGMKYGLQKM